MKQKQVTSSFVEEIMEEHSFLHFIAFNEDSVLAVSEKSKRAHFFYKVNDDVPFHCNLLSEVGQMYQEWFKVMIKCMKYKIAPKETETDYFDTLTH